MFPTLAKMGVMNFLHPRRRGLLIRLLAVVMFLSIVCLWLKSDSRLDDSDAQSFRSPRESDGETLGNINALPVENVVPKNLAKDVVVNTPNHKSPISHSEVGHFNPEPQLGLPRSSETERFEKSRALAMFAADEAKVVPGLGEMGKAVHLKGSEAVRAEEIMKVEAFNRVLSDKISVNRSVPDSRDPL